MSMRILSKSVTRQLGRFHPDIRHAVTTPAGRQARLADLVFSFPALLVALARPRAGFNPEPVIAAVVAGVPLTALAERARVPLWLRRMTPQMIAGPLPELPDSPFIRHRIVNHFPVHRNYADWWFGAVSNGNRWTHENFALLVRPGICTPYRPTPSPPSPQHA